MSFLLYPGDKTTFVGLVPRTGPSLQEHSRPVRSSDKIAPAEDEPYEHVTAKPPLTPYP